MDKRIALMSYGRLTELVQEAVEPEILNSINIYNASFQKALDIVKNLIRQKKIDVIVTGGSNYSFLRKHVTSLPIIDIEISGFDVLESIEKGFKRSNKIAIVSYKDSITWKTSYNQIFSGEIIYATYNSKKSLNKCLDDVREDDCKCVLGTSLVCDVAEEKGLPFVFLYSQESVRRAIRRAIELHKSLIREQERTQQLSVILDLIPSGIVAIDNSGSVTLYNPAAARLTGVSPKQALGENIKNLIPNTRLDKVAVSGQEERQQFQTMPNGTVILTDRVPIKIEDRVIGAVATFSATEDISQAERHIRMGFHKKGLVAKHNFSDIVGSSKKIVEAKLLAKLYAQEESTVLITGETGTGKELFAQSIHNNSNRKLEPFVTINCAALPEDLLESELFGYEEGAFTGARKGGKMGLLELGHRGTVFLDEIGQISKKVQSRLLRVLEEKEIMRVGSDKVNPINIRVIAASNRQLMKEVAEGLFRDDLFYRLNVLHIELPPLRERKDDLEDLMVEIIKQEGKYYLFKKNEKAFMQALNYLKNYHWPGNVREFRSVVKRLCLVFENNLTLDYVFKGIMSYQDLMHLQNDEQVKLFQALKQAGGNRTHAAELLGISRTTLWRKLKKIQ